jgi:spore maturation protein CgeB
MIDYYHEHQDEATRIARQGRKHVLEHHTYTVRMRQLVDLLRAERLISRPPGRPRKAPVAV